jgi:hypothetical protein
MFVCFSPVNATPGWKTLKITSLQPATGARSSPPSPSDPSFVGNKRNGGFGKCVNAGEGKDDGENPNGATEKKRIAQLSRKKEKAARTPRPAVCTSADLHQVDCRTSRDTHALDDAGGARVLRRVGGAHSNRRETRLWTRVYVFGFTTRCRARSGPPWS